MQLYYKFHRCNTDRSSETYMNVKIKQNNLIMKNRSKSEMGIFIQGLMLRSEDKLGKSQLLRK